MKISCNLNILLCYRILYYKIRYIEAEIFKNRYLDDVMM